MGLKEGTGYITEEEKNFRGKANLNKKGFEKYWDGKDAILSIEELSKTERGVTRKVDGNNGGYFFSGERGYLQIPLKRVNITEKSIEGILIITEKPCFKEKAQKVYGIIKELKN